MGKRGKTKHAPGYYAERKKSGQFKKFTGIGRSIRADKRQKAEYRPDATGYGHQGDY